MKKPSTRTLCRNGQLSIGLDLGDRSSCYCVLIGSGEVILEAKVPTNPEAMKKANALIECIGDLSLIDGNCTEANRTL